jgi:hypothetical protein
MKAYHLTPELEIEYFGDKALILVVEHDRFLTVNKAAVSLLKLMQDVFGGKTFSDKDLLSLLLERYHIPEIKVHDTVRKIIASWLKHGILIKEKK